MDRFIESNTLAELYSILSEDRRSLSSSHSMTRFERQLMVNRVYQKLCEAVEHFVDFPHKRLIFGAARSK